MKKIPYLLYLIGILMTNAQVGVNTSSPDTDALLDLQTAATVDKGLLLPKVSLTSTSNSNPLTSHVQGMVVYNTSTSMTTPETAVSPGFYVNDGIEWNRIELLPLIKRLPTVGDIKYSAQNTDHDGWYILNGQNVSSLPAAAQNNGLLLGFVSTLPDATNRFLRMKNGTDLLGSNGGNSSVSIARNNLPNVQYNSRVTSSSGAHTHTYTDYAGTVSSSPASIGGENVVPGSSSTIQTQSAGAHTHTFSISSGGGNQSFNITPSYIASNAFVYLGQ